MQLSHYLKPQSIIFLKATSKHDALAELVHELCRRENIPHTDELVSMIGEREKLSSTFLPMGIAVPHARVPYVGEVTMITGISKTGIIDTLDQAPLTAYIFFLFFSPTEEKEFGKHLKLLARIAAVFSDPILVQELAQMTTPEQIFSRIQKRERQIDRE